MTTLREEEKKGIMTKQKETLPQTAPGEIQIGQQKKFLHGESC